MVLHAHEAPRRSHARSPACPPTTLVGQRPLRRVGRRKARRAVVRGEHRPGPGLPGPPALARRASGREILPVFWDDNYFELFPGEKREIRVAFPRARRGRLCGDGGGLERAARNSEGERCDEERWTDRTLGLIGSGPPRQRPRWAEERRATTTTASAGGRQRVLRRASHTADAACGFAWPKPPTTGWDTALLGVQVDAGAEEGAWVELAAGSARVRQYLDPAARGLRWINLSGLKPQLSEGAEVEIAAHGAHVAPGPAALRVFANRLDLARADPRPRAPPRRRRDRRFRPLRRAQRDHRDRHLGQRRGRQLRDDFPDPAEQYLFKGYLRAVDSVTVPWQGGIPPDRCSTSATSTPASPRCTRSRAEVVRRAVRPEQGRRPLPPRQRQPPRSPRGRARTAGRTSSPTWSASSRRSSPQIVVMPYPQLDYPPRPPVRDGGGGGGARALEGPDRASCSTRTMPRRTSTRSAPRADGDVAAARAGPASCRWKASTRTRSARELQRRKLYALETMHDLRLSPAEQASCCDPAARPKRPDYPRQPAVDYFRRGPRSDEVFFVFGRDGVRDLIRSFLADRKARRPARERSRGRPGADARGSSGRSRSGTSSSTGSSSSSPPPPWASSGWSARRPAATSSPRS